MPRHICHYFCVDTIRSECMQLLSTMNGTPSDASVHAGVVLELESLQLKRV